MTTNPLATKGRWHSLNSLYKRVHYAQRNYLYECWYCGDALTRYDQNDLRPTARTIDHVVPLSLEGQDIRANRVWSCLRCNKEKKDLLPDDAILDALGMSIKVNSKRVVVSYDKTAVHWPDRKPKGNVKWN